MNAADAPFRAFWPEPGRPSARPSRDRCDGSLQLTMTAGAGPCPVCGATVDTVPLDGRPVLVEHRRRSDEALPMSLFGG